MNWLGTEPRPLRPWSENVPRLNQ